MISTIKLSTLEQSIILKNLKGYFSPEMIAEGKSLKESVSFSEKRLMQRILAFVLDFKMYLVEVEIDQKSFTFTTQCNCKNKRKCKHGVAAVLKLMEEYGTTATKEKLPKKKILRLIKNKFGINKPNTFRLLPTHENIGLDETINLLSQDHNHYYDEELEIIIEGPDLVSIKTIESLRFTYWKREQYSIQLKVEKGKLYTKCDQCNVPSAHLCPHQNAMLQNTEVKEALHHFLEYGIQYDTIFKNIHDKFGLNQKEVEEYLKIFYTEEQYYVKAKNGKLIINPEENFEFLNLRKNDLVLEDSIDKLKSKYDFSNALLWTDRSDVLLIQGKWNKARTRLISGFSEVPSPTSFNSEQEVLWNKMVKANYERDESALLSIAKNNLEILSSMLNFYQRLPNAITKKNLHQIRIVPECTTLKTEVIEEGALFKINFFLQLKNKKVKPSEIEWYNQFLIVHEGNGYLMQELTIGELLLKLGGRDQLAFLKKQFSADILKQFAEIGDVHMKGIEKVKLENGIRQIHVREVNSFLVFEPSLIYNEKFKFSVFKSTSEYDGEQKIIYHASEEEVENYIELIKSMHETWDLDYVPQGYVYLHVKEALEDFWIIDIFEKLQEAGVEIYGQENLKSVDLNLNRINVRSHIKSGIDWFEANVEINYGEVSVAKKEWVEAIKNNRKYIRLSDGTLGVVPEMWVKKLNKLLAVSEVDKDKWKISKSRFNIVEDLFDEIDDEFLRKEILERKDALAQYDKNKKYKMPKNLKAKLRDYQLHGYRWMRFLEDFGFGGCLADDMGLGKTVQVLALLLQQKNVKKGTSLIVVPRSLLFNWAQEIDKFTPDLKYLIHHGSNRNWDAEEYKRFDLVITTYDTVVRDIGQLQDFIWNYVVLDESQAIKNPSSKRYKAIRLLKSHNKLAMTGTPIENNTFDLYAQFSFLNPGIFGSQKRFRDQFSTPIDTLRDPERTETLKKIIHPFLLRRTKEQVANDLPEKTESIIYCDMGKHQRKQYEELKNYVKVNLESAVVNDDGNAKFMILDGLLKLRQICNSPELVDNTLPPKKKESVKIETLLNLISEDLGDHKALIFSQFVSMLSLIRNRLDKLGIKYAYLDGSTRDRQAAVKDFMDNEDCQLFLISIKAGNTGLNLTMADYVYIIDPWWNPAVESQAIDRTHRIGQNKKVFAYKMICNDTIEEKIIQLQDKKKSLASDLIQVEENVFKSLSKEELMQLFD